MAYDPALGSLSSPMLLPHPSPERPHYSLSPRPLLFPQVGNSYSTLKSPSTPTVGSLPDSPTQKLALLEGSAGLHAVFHFSSCLFIWNPLGSHPHSQVTVRSLKSETMSLWIAASPATNAVWHTAEACRKYEGEWITPLPACQYVIWAQENTRDMWIYSTETQEANS